MKAGDLIRFIKTGAMGIIVEVIDKASDLSGPKALVYCAWEDEETGNQHNESLWYYSDYILKCAEPADFDHSAMRGGRL